MIKVKVGEKDLPKRLGDPCNDRVMKDVVPPFVQSPTDEIVFTSVGLPNWNVIIHIFMGEGSLTKSQAMTIMQDAL